MNRLGTYFALGICLTLLVGCKNNHGNQGAALPETKAKPLLVAASKTTQANVAKIVFVGQKDACECTRDRIDTSWTALQKVLGENSGILVERIQLDVEDQEADRLDDLRAMIVVPGIYFIDKNEDLLEMLQGEVTPRQVEKML